MNALDTILLISILGFEAFQFASTLNIIKKILNSLESRINDIIKDQISMLLNDKELYDSLKDYFGSLAQGIMGKFQSKNSNNLFQTLLGTILQRFIPIPREIGENSKIDNTENKTLKNPFTK